MEVRKITVVQTREQKKNVIMSSAITLGELKADLRSNGIDYAGMTFFEGISKIELKTDDSVLPHDIPYKGQVTNELVFMLTNTNKKIKSGADTMSRAEAYSAIKFMGLQNACIKKFGKNFTMCKTADLIALVQSNGASKPAPAAPKAEASKAETKKEEKVEAPVNTPEASAPVAPPSNGGDCVDKAARAAIRRFASLLKDMGIIEDYDKKEIFVILKGEVPINTAPSEEYKPKSTSPYSDDEIDEMFAEMGID